MSEKNRSTFLESIVLSLQTLVCFLMDLSSDASMLIKLDSHSFREICNYLETRDLLNVWSINDRRICALLRRCDAFGP